MTVKCQMNCEKKFLRLAVSKVAIGWLIFNRIKFNDEQIFQAFPINNLILYIVCVCVRMVRYNSIDSLGPFALASMRHWRIASNYLGEKEISIDWKEKELFIYFVWVILYLFLILSSCWKYFLCLYCFVVLLNQF